MFDTFTQKFPRDYTAAYTNMNLTNPPCLTSFLPGDTSDSRNSSLSTEEATKMHKISSRKLIIIMRMYI